MISPRVGFVVVLCLFAAPAHADRVGSPVGALVVRSDGPSFPELTTNTIEARIDAGAVGDGFSTIAGFELSVRAIGSHEIVLLGLPENGSGSIDTSHLADGWVDVRVTIDPPLRVLGRVVPLLQVQTVDPAGSSVFGPTVQALPSFAGPVDGWATWRESDRSGACSDTDPSERPCLRPFDRIPRPVQFVSDRFDLWIPQIVVSPGERFHLPVRLQCLSALPGMRSLDLAAVDAPVSWASDQFRLVGARVAPRRADFDSTGSFATRLEFDPPRAIPDTTEDLTLFELEFEALADATGSIVRIDSGADATEPSGVSAFGARFAGGVRVLDCTPFDADGDGRISTQDAILVLRDALRGVASARALCARDVDRNGRIEPNDAVQVLRRTVGLGRAQHATAGVGTARASVEGDRLVLHVGGAAAALVTLEIGDSAFATVTLEAGDGLLATDFADGRLRVALASARVGDHAIAIESTGGSVRIVDVQMTDATGRRLDVVVDDGPVTIAAPAWGFRGAFPNPFNPRTRLRFALEAAGTAHLDIHDARGRRVRSFVVDAPAGESTVTWDGRDEDGEAVASGIFHVRMRTPEGTSFGKITLLE